jgi:hypothetical protein
LFENKINFKVGERVYKALEIKTDEVYTSPATIKAKGFWFCDLFVKLQF